MGSIEIYIQRSYSIDIGRLIQNSILCILVGLATGSLGHPSLIHGLYVQGGITM